MPREIDIVPFASNELTSDYLYAQRDYYNTSSLVYPKEDDFNNTLSKPLDIWYQKPNWGKVDTRGRLVFPDTDILRSTVNGLSVVNFVADAYTDFKNFVLDARTKFRTSMTSFIDIDKPKKAHDNVVLNYQNYFENTLDQNFNNVFLSDEDKSSIMNFKDFSREYSFFVETNREIPHTLAGYLLSPRTDYRISGLIIEFGEDGYDNDTDKWNNYLSNDFFYDYVKLAASFGFYVRKNVPWAIAANLNSNRMKNYMVPYRTTSATQMFNTNYLQAEYMSYISFKKYMFFSYASFISHRPRIEIMRYKNCIKKTLSDSSFKTEREITLRPSEISYFDPSYSKFTSIYSDYTFMKLYVNIRLIEEKVNLTNQKFDSLIRRLVYEFENTDIYGAMLYFSEFLADKRINNFSKLTRLKSPDRMSQRSGFPSGESTSNLIQRIANEIADSFGY
tara:strand:+ start:16732 stop:18072 length:1341 start_codon:yes stop_codon:yes gene_type:complete